MNNSITKRSVNEHSPDAGAIQSKVDLQHLAREFLGDGLPGGDAAVYIIPQFNPDNAEYHIFPSYFRNPITGDRGGAIRFVQRIRRCNYGSALAFLEGWLMGLEAIRL